VGDEHPSKTMPQEWDFPSMLFPHTQSAANSHGLVYDLMGLALTNEDGNHFIARYASDNKKVIYTYDDLANNGHPIREKPTRFDTHVAGKHVDLPQSFVVYQAFYLLRGGAVAQDLFFQVRTAALAKKFNLRFSTNNLDRLFSMTYHSDQFVELESNKRTWLLNPLRSRTLEYVSHNAPANVTEESLSPESKEDAISQPGSPTTPINADMGHTALPSPLSSLPDSEFELNCQCGIIGNGNILYRHEHGVAIQCDECCDWSHIACQRDGRASNLAPDARFICDSCDLSHHFPLSRKSKRK
jgi:hypothetical protein